MCASKYAATSASVAVIWPRNADDGTWTSWTFTFSFRRVNSASASASVTATQSVTTARSFSTSSCRRRLASNSPGDIGGLARVQHGLVLRFADELAVQLELRHRQDPLPDLVVGDRHAEALGLGDHRLLVDQLLQHLLLEAELSEQLLADAGPVRLPVGRHLALVGGPELQDADAPAVHLRDLVAWQGSAGGVFRAQEVRDVQNDERHHHKAEAPLEPALVTPHTVEHRHGACISIQSKLLV